MTCLRHPSSAQMHSAVSLLSSLTLLLLPLFSVAQLPTEHVSVQRPLPTSSLTPSCVLSAFSQTFANTTALPPVTLPYIPPPACRWSRAVLKISASCNGTQTDRIASVWLSGVELIRTSTPQSRSNGVFWNVEKDVTRYSAVLRQSNITLSVMLENTIDSAHSGVYKLDISFFYYNLLSNSNPEINPNSAKFGDNTRKHDSLVLDETPSDMIIPIAATGEGGFWFKIQSRSDSVRQEIQIPPNTYRAVIEIYASSHGNDKSWYTNPSNSYPIKPGKGAYREIMVKVDGTTAGTMIPFPIIYSSAINPFFWEPLASIRVFDLPAHDIELTPFLATLLDGKPHYLEISVADAISYWLVTANLHLFLDASGTNVEAGVIRYRDPGTRLQREVKSEILDGTADVRVDRDSEWTGWVYSSRGNFTTRVKRNLQYESTINYYNNGAGKEVKQEARTQSEVLLTTVTGQSYAKFVLDRKVPLTTRTVTQRAGGGDNYRLTTKLEYSLEEQTQERGYESTLYDKQVCDGWMSVDGDKVVSGKARTSQQYKLQDKFGCYSRHVVADGGAIRNDGKMVLCASATAAL